MTAYTNFMGASTLLVTTTLYKVTTTTGTGNELIAEAAILITAIIWIHYTIPLLQANLGGMGK